MEKNLRPARRVKRKKSICENHLMHREHLSVKIVVHHQPKPKWFVNL